MFNGKDLTYQKEFSFPCNKCGGVVVAEYNIDYSWDDMRMYLDKIYCLECKRTFLEYSFKRDEESNAVIDFKWVKWKD